MSDGEIRHEPGAPLPAIVARCAPGGLLEMRALSGIPLSQPRLGSGRAPRLHYRLPPDAPRVVCAVIEPLTIGDEFWLESVLCPDAGEPERRAFASVVVDVRFDDGTALTDDRPPDQHGIPLHPHDRARSRILFVEEWNYAAVSLAAHTGRRIVAIEIAALPAPGAVAITGWLESLRIGAGRRLAPLPVDGIADPTPADHVDTRRGTRSSADYSRGNCLPATAVPNGFNLFTPVTDAGTLRWLYSYDADADASGRPALESLAVSHQPSPWMGDRATFQFFPSTRTQGRPPMSRADRRMTFHREREQARPHEYRVDLDDGVRVAIAPTMHGALVEMTFPTEIGTVLFDNVDDRGELAFAGDVVTARSWTAEAYSEAAPAMHVHLRFDSAPFETKRCTVDGRRNVAGYARFRLGPDRVLRFRLATSFLDDATARHALETEVAPFADIDAAAGAAKAQWNDLLSCVDLSAATVDQRVALFSCVYRVFLFPNWQTEIDPATGLGIHASVHGGGRRDGAIAVNHGFWDTYRTVWPFLALVRPSLAGALADGFLQHYRDDGWMPRWAAPGPADVMVGTSSDIVFADLVAKGVGGFDARLALESALTDANVTPPRPEVGRRGLPASLPLHHTPSSTHESVSWTVENALDDFGVAVLLTLLTGSDPALAAYYEARATDYRRLFDPRTGFLRARSATGGFGCERFDPARWGSGYTETNAWNVLFAVPHDVNGLAELLGGPDALEAMLDRFFATPETASPALRGTYPGVIHEMREARDVGLGMLGLSNQPSHHIPFLYAHTRAPSKAHPIVRDAMRRLFVGSEIGQGYLGDEDNGEMSAWYLLSALGLYPVHVGTTYYVLTPPLLPSIAVRLESGGILHIRRVGDDAWDHIVGVTLDGVAIDRASVTHDEIAAGGELVVQMGPQPSDWARDAWRELPSLVDTAPLRDLTTRARVRPRAARRLIDDRGAHSFSRDAVVTIRMDAAGRMPRFLVLTSGEVIDEPIPWRLVRAGRGAGDAASAVAASAVVASVVVAEGRTGFDRAFQAVPHPLPTADAARSLELQVILTPRSSLSQIELLA